MPEAFYHTISFHCNLLSYKININKKNWPNIAEYQDIAMVAEERNIYKESSEARPGMQFGQGRNGRS